MRDPVSVLLSDWSALAIVGKAAIAVQLCLVIHVIKTGRPFWWIWILFMAPVIGGLAYFFLEVLPDLRRADSSNFLDSLKPRSWHIRDLRSALEESDTFNTRIELAQALLDNGEAAEAQSIAMGALTGVFRNDPTVKAEVAHFMIEAGNAAGALKLLNGVRADTDRFLRLKIQLLVAMAHFHLGNLDEAERILGNAVDDSFSEQTRVYLARVLLAKGKTEEGLSMLRDIKTKYRKGGRLWRRSEKRWFEESTALLKKHG
jgi:hypothetical protein